MNITDVIHLYTELNNLGIEVWLDGGWGVDALLGEQTRRHADVDIVIQQKDVPKLRAFLKTKGYEDVARDDTSTWNFVLGDNHGRIVKRISPEYMVKFHTGYELRENDWRDVSALCARFGIDYPADYASSKQCSCSEISE